MPRSLLTLITLSIFALTTPLRAQSAYPEGAPEFSLGIGYANINIGPAIDNEDGIRFDPSLTFSPFEGLPQLRLGTSVGFTLVLDNTTRTLISNDGNLLYRGSSDIPLWTLEPELRISWRQHFGDNRQFFIEPGVAGGVAFTFLTLDSDDPNIDSYDESDNTFFGRVFLRAGAQVTGGMAGIEASWLRGSDIDLGGDASGDLEEFYIGIFGALVF